jgi:hypothetical protein
MTIARVPTGSARGLATGGLRDCIARVCPKQRLDEADFVLAARDQGGLIDFESEFER